MSLSPKGTDNQLIFFSEGGFWDRSYLVKGGLAALFALVVFLFLHYGDLRTETLNLNTPAPNYTFSQTDFTYKDDEASYLAKEEAVKEIDFIRSVSEIDCAEKLSAMQRWLIHSRHRPQEIEEIQRIAVAVIGELKRVIFVSEKTRDLMKRFDMPTDHCIVWYNGNDDKVEILPSLVWDEVARISRINYGSSLSKGAMNKALDYFSHCEWQVEVDAHYQNQFRRHVADEIAPVIKSVRAGTTLIDRGDTVAQRHLDMQRAMKETLKGQRRLSSWHAFCALPLAIIGVFFGALYLRCFQKEIFQSNRQLTLILIICSLTLALAKGGERALIHSAHGGMSVANDPLITPFTTILAASLFPLKVAAFISAYMTLVLTFGLPVDSSMFLPINFAGTLIALINARRLVKQRDLFSVCIQVWAAAAVMTLALDLHARTSSLHGQELIEKCAILGLFTIVTAVLVVILLPFVEMIFGIMTDMTLMEYLDPNSLLLRRLSIEAPGTYQHSLFVSHLAESAALSINARALFCRVSSLYHDIGKLAYPHYFVENQKDINVHLLLTPSESANAILGHVTEGVAIARQYHPPEPLVQIIKEHHGTGLVNYFYSRECELLGDEGKVEQKSFRYRGPIPQSKESLIIMLCDTLEAISRSMDQVTETKVEEVLNNQISWLISSGQFDVNAMSLCELHTVKKNLIKTLVAANHSRVKYQAKTRQPAPAPMMRELPRVSPEPIRPAASQKSATLVSTRVP